MDGEGRTEAYEEVGVPDWDGRGLPPVARARVDRFASSGLRTSLLSVPGAIGAEVAGFTPVGEVMGCVVERLGWTAGFGITPTQQAAIYADALRQGYRIALDRLRLEAEAIGADGVLGITTSVTRLDETMQEFVALGTAVRAESRQRPGRVFTTELPGQDVGKLMQAGWVPAAVAIGISANTTFDYNMQYQTTMWAGNVEVDAHTRLVTEVRADARSQFRKTVQTTGADGAIVSRMSLDTWQLGEVAVAGVASVFGTAIARFHSGSSAPTSALTILPLNRA
ncbi:heavy metal-binding domain-containing protein [Amycolatopsis rhabdoformis]|uniref:Heavy metal-binding domain-containing protein n=1 Tax=Amycolatopsis rhabdoformis TaxID=1448059 RepID=A0ABZ1I7B9_9PSEU|nr:heavy metal-binding domain-containing protein [Amycolatopsis rhabdoformis]WSE29763.1 heavy metal-binding domain-containing protein [Amycolatopsis rhabdoformis]